MKVSVRLERVSGESSATLLHTFVRRDVYVRVGVQYSAVLTVYTGALCCVTVQYSAVQNSAVLHSTANYVTVCYVTCYVTFHYITIDNYIVRYVSLSNQ